MKANIEQINEYHQRRNMLHAMDTLEGMLAERRYRIRINWFKFARAVAVVGLVIWFIRSIV